MRACSCAKTPGRRRGTRRKLDRALARRIAIQQIAASSKHKRRLLQIEPAHSRAPPITRRSTQTLGTYVNTDADVRQPTRARLPLTPTSPAAAQPRRHAAAQRRAAGGATAGQPLTLTLDLSDGSTGLAVEDIVPHHEALVHLVIISADGGDFHHLHPARVAQGRYTIELTPDRPGRYTAYAEIQRRDSGTQVIARDFDIGGTTSAVPPSAPGLGVREVAGMQVNATSSITPLITAASLPR